MKYVAAPSSPLELIKQPPEKVHNAVRRLIMDAVCGGLGKKAGTVGNREEKKCRSVTHSSHAEDPPQSLF